MEGGAGHTRSTQHTPTTLGRHATHMSTDILRPVQTPLVDQVLQARHKTAQGSTHAVNVAPHTTTATSCSSPPHTTTAASSPSTLHTNHYCLIPQHTAHQPLLPHPPAHCTPPLPPPAPVHRTLQHTLQWSLRINHIHRLTSPRLWRW